MADDEQQTPRTRKFGKLEFLPASQLTVIPRYQRTPKPTRVRDLQRRWDDNKVGCLHVSRITEGQYKGRNHIVNGGTRWAAMHGLNGVEGLDPDYIFPCYVEEMSGHGAANAFLAQNDESMKPSAFFRYRVGTAAGKPDALAIQKALKYHKLVADEGRSVYGDGENQGMFAALAAADRIVTNSHALTDDWDLDAAHLIWVLGITRRAYPQHGQPGAAHAHDADIIQATSSIGLRNPAVVEQPEHERDLIGAMTTFYQGDRRTPIFGGAFEDHQTMRPTHWRMAYMHEKRGSTGGSESRGTHIARLIVQNLHRHVGYRLNL